jgi:uncharacterized protein
VFIKRKIEEVLVKRSKEYPVLAIMGPRQSGKTTIARKIFDKHTYLNLEEFDLQEYASKDPKGFLERYANDHGLILDEIQRVPNLTSYIQVQVDENRVPGYFVITGSQNILMGNRVSQSLAGRVAIITLLPLSIQELSDAGLLPNQPEELIYKGCYPSIYAHQVDINNWYKNYINTYLEKDIRQMQNIAKLSDFRRFMGLCAGRIGQILNVSSLATDTGVSVNTVKGWLSLLEESYILFLLQPHYKNFSKRLIKSPKIYFYDTGLARSLLKIENENDLYNHYLRGGLFESLIISELYKDSYNRDKQPNIYFWRNQSGNELDVILERALELIPVEIKAGHTVNENFFKGLKYWHTLTGDDPKKGYIIYAGDENQIRSYGNVVSWRDISNRTF